MQIQWTKSAQNNLKHMEEHISSEDSEAAIYTVFKVIDAIGHLKAHPEMGRVGRVFNTRELVVAGTPFIVIYRLKDKKVQILRVLHSSMKWPDSH